MVSLTKTAAALAALAMSSGVAAAAVAATDLNMRAGPGTEHPVIGVIPGGASVDVLGCSGGWCEVNRAGRTGYASASYLSGDGSAMAAPSGAYAYTPPVYYRPRVYGYPYRPSGYGAYAYDGPTIGFGIGPGFFGVW